MSTTPTCSAYSVRLAVSSSVMPSRRGSASMSLTMTLLLGSRTTSSRCRCDSLIADTNLAGRAGPVNEDRLHEENERLGEQLRKDAEAPERLRLEARGTSPPARARTASGE